MKNNLLAQVKRVVVKVGSGVLTTTKGLNMNIIDDLATDICAIREKGVEVVLVSSGAIASGLKKMGLSKRPPSLSQQQAVAAIGQTSLMMAYEEAFGRYGQKAAQILITRDDLIHRRRYLNARNTLFTLLGWKIIPVINENDTVVVDEIKFGDNDNLSAMVTNLTDAHLLVNLTRMPGSSELLKRWIGRWQDLRALFPVSLAPVVWPVKSKQHRKLRLVAFQPSSLTA